jgi:hypothetical protein
MRHYSNHLCVASLLTSSGVLSNPDGQLLPCRSTSVLPDEPSSLLEQPSFPPAAPSRRPLDLFANADLGTTIFEDSNARSDGAMPIPTHDTTGLREWSGQSDSVFEGPGGRSGNNGHTTAGSSPSLVSPLNRTRTDGKRYCLLHEVFGPIFTITHSSAVPSGVASFSTHESDGVVAS